MVPRLKAVLRTLHGDERGAIGILVLLTIWCLVALLGLVWNTMEVAYRRQRIQTAADAAAYSTQNWVSRTINAITAQNMVISQDASTETIWAAVPDTDTALTKELNDELEKAEQLRAAGGLEQLTRRLQIELQNIATERDLMTVALNNLVAAPSGNYADANEALRFKEQYRRAQSVSDWVWNTYVQGAAPPPPNMAYDPPPPQRPGPPGPNGEGLAQLVLAWKPSNEGQILDYIENFIDGRAVGRVAGYTYYPRQEMSIVEGFRARTALARSQQIDKIMAEHEANVYAAEVAMAQTLADTINQERSAQMAAYQADITLATLKRATGSSGSATVTAPLMPAGDALPVTGHMDKIREAFPIETAAAKLSPVIDIDAVNVHVNPTGNTNGRINAIIWHPDIQATVSGELLLQYPNLKPAYRVTANFPDSLPVGSPQYPEGWGHIWAMPLEHYVHQRVNADSGTLNRDYMVVLDRARTQTLAKVIRSMMGLPNSGNIAIKNLPMTLPDDTPALEIPPVVRKPGDPPPPPPEYVNLRVMPAITAPASASPAFRAQVMVYNQHGGAYTGAVRRLRGSIISYTAFFDQFTQAFASLAWSGAVQGHCIQVLETLGTKKQFLVLNSYGLRPIPQWAQAGMYTSVATMVENHVMLINLPQVADAIVKDMQNTDSRGVGAGILDATTKNWVTYSAYIGNATAIADAIVRPRAQEIAQDIATEWINRPWPYEIEPPTVPVPPFRGINPVDRKREYTLLAGARPTEATAPKLALPKIFGAGSAPLAAYAQAETFNWMEFNSAYGGSERFDEVVFVPEVTYLNARRQSFHNFVGSPRGWRVDSIGGWDWRTRLSFSDALYEALPLNDELRGYLEDAGFVNAGQGALDEVNLH